MATLRILTPPGAEVRVPVGGDSPRPLSLSVLETQRALGAPGWRGTTPPAVGFRFTPANEGDFDRRLLEGRCGTCPVEGEERLLARGHFCTRREFDPNPRMKMDAAVKFSRVARPAGPPEVEEEGDGTFRSVTRAVVRGEGRSTPCPAARRRPTNGRMRRPPRGTLALGDGPVHAPVT